MSSSREKSEAARAVMDRYTDAVHRADIDALKNIFHPGAFMTGYLGDDFLVGTPEPFLADLGGRPSMAESEAPYQAEITYFEADDRVAVAVLRENGFFGEGSFVNYFTLLEYQGEWRIMSKTFASR